MCVYKDVLYQVTSATFVEANDKTLNKVIQNVTDTNEHVLCHHPLKEKSLHILDFSDASFPKNMDLSTQLGYIVMLTDESGKENVLHDTSYKKKRVVRSVFGRETLAFSDAFGAAFSIRIDLMGLLQRKIKLTMITDSMTLLKFLVN